MTNSKQNDADESLIIAFLYQSLTDKQQQDFEVRLENDKAFRQLFEQQKALDKMIQPGIKVSISEQRMDAVRWALQKDLRKEQSKQSSIYRKLSALWQSKVSFNAQFASMLFTFLLGVLITQNYSEQSTKNSSVAIDQPKASALGFIKDEDYQITDLRLSQFGTQPDEVKITYSIASQTQLEGRLSNQRIQNLLAATMKNDVSDSTRLELADVLKNYVKSTVVRDALSYSLLNDPNPGVRMIAAQSLTTLSADRNIRKVLTEALKNDSNPGIRVEIFNALSKHLDDPETMTTITQHSISDGNEYIRQRAKNILSNQYLKIEPQT